MDKISTMPPVKIALANVRVPASRDESLDIVLHAMQFAAEGGARVICFPECIIPGYRLGAQRETHDPNWMVQAWGRIDAMAGRLGLTVILGTEREVKGELRITARVTHPDGSLAGFQDKVQLDPSEEPLYAAGDERRVFEADGLCFGVVICHEGWRYPETVRWAARRGAQVVFHPHFEIPGSAAYLPKAFSEPQNTFHEKAALCRAAENHCYFATVNCALPQGACTTSAVVDPEGSLLAYQPYGEAGILFCEIEPNKATGYLAERLRPLQQ